MISSQGVHDRYGGVVPEIASRHHLELVNAVVDDALARAGASARRRRRWSRSPRGRGWSARCWSAWRPRRALAAARRLPLAPVDHLQGHVAATYLEPEPMEPPFLCLLASGGHTLLARVTEPGAYEVLGRTLDDAAGEAFDKGARLLGLPLSGRAGALEAGRSTGDPTAFAFPRAERVAGLDFSFAGLKTALLYAVRDLGEEETARRAADLAASYEARDRRRADPAGRARAGGRAGRAARARRRRGGEPAAARARRRAGRRAEGPAVRALHRQRGDDRARPRAGSSRCATPTTSTWTRTRPARRHEPPGPPRRHRPRAGRARRCCRRGGAGRAR